jgi:F-type H+-transporting ATPase subunit delta
MAAKSLARRYAQAAFGLAVEQGAVEQWRRDIEDVATVLVDSPAAPVLANTRIPLAERLRVVERALQVDPLVLNLAKLLVTRGRSGIARQVAEAFGRLADDHEGIVHARVTTAIDLPSDELASIERRLSESTGKRVRTEVVVDPAIIGGVIIRMGDKLLDGSVRTRLRLLKRQLEGVR